MTSCLMAKYHTFLTMLMQHFTGNAHFLKKRLEVAILSTGTTTDDTLDVGQSIVTGT